MSNSAAMRQTLRAALCAVTFSTSLSAVSGCVWRIGFDPPQGDPVADGGDIVAGTGDFDATGFRYDLLPDLTIVSDRPLVAVSEVMASAPAIVGHVVATTTPPIVDTSLQPALLASFAPVVPQKAVALTVTLTALPVTVNAMIPFNATVTVSTVLPVVATPTCALLGPYATLACAYPSFTVASDEIVGGPLQIELRGGSPTNRKQSNALPTTRYAVAQVAATAGDPEISDIFGGNTSSWAYDAGVFYFSARIPGPVFELQVYEFSEATGAVRRIQSLEGFVEPRHLQAVNGVLYFFGRLPGVVIELFSFDGTTLTRTDLALGGPWYGSGVYDGKYIFDHYWTTPTNRKLFSFDGVQIAWISDTDPDNRDEPTESSGQYRVCGDWLFFDARNDLQRHKVHAYNGRTTPRVLNQIADTMGANNLADWPSGYDCAGNFFVYRSNTPAAADRLYAYEIGGGETYLLGDGNFVAYTNGRIFLARQHAAGGRKLYAFDTTARTLTQLSDLRADPALDDMPASRGQILGQELLLLAETNPGAAKLFTYDLGTGTLVQRSDTRGGPTASDFVAPGRLNGCLFDNAFFFVAENEFGADKLFRYRRGEPVVQVSNTSGDASTTDAILLRCTSSPVALYFTAVNSFGGRKQYGLCRQDQNCPFP